MILKTLKELQSKRYKIKSSLLYKLFPSLFKCKLNNIKNKITFLFKQNE